MPERVDQLVTPQEGAALRDLAASARRQPDFDALIGMAGRRRKRRRIRWGAALGALVLLGTVGWFGQGAASSSHHLAEDRADRVDLRQYEPSAPPPIDPAAGPQPVAASFADHAHGAALVATCTEGPDYRCHYGLRMTTDGGQTWVARRVPLFDVLAPERFAAQLRTPGPNSILVVDRGIRMFSPDGGFTWRRPGPSLRPVASSVAPGSMITVTCAILPPSNRCSSPDVVVLDPATGGAQQLPNRPELIPRWPSQNRLPSPSDGSIWVPGRIPSAGPAVAVSRDGGRSWLTRTLPAPPGLINDMDVVSTDGRTGYLFVRVQGRRPDRAGAPAQLLFVTRDGGAHWKRVNAGFNGSHPRAVVGAALLGDDQLLVTTERQTDASQQQTPVNVLISADGGRVFQPLWSRGPRLGEIDSVPGRYVAPGADGGFYTSTDGLTWNSLRV